MTDDPSSSPGPSPYPRALPALAAGLGVVALLLGCSGWFALAGVPFAVLAILCAGGALRWAPATPAARSLAGLGLLGGAGLLLIVLAQLLQLDDRLLGAWPSAAGTVDGQGDLP